MRVPSVLAPRDFLAAYVMPQAACFPHCAPAPALLDGSPCLRHTLSQGAKAIACVMSDRECQEHDVRLPCQVTSSPPLDGLGYFAGSMHRNLVCARWTRPRRAAPVQMPETPPSVSLPDLHVLLTPCDPSPAVSDTPGALKRPQLVRCGPWSRQQNPIRGRGALPPRNGDPPGGKPRGNGQRLPLAHSVQPATGSCVSLAGAL